MLAKPFSFRRSPLSRFSALRTILPARCSVHRIVTPLHTRLSSPPKSFKFQRHNSSIRPDIGFNILLTASAHSAIIFRADARIDRATIWKLPARIGRMSALCNTSPPIFRRSRSAWNERSKVSLAVTIIPVVVVVVARYRQRWLSTNRFDGVSLSVPSHFLFFHLLHRVYSPIYSADSLYWYCCYFRGLSTNLERAPLAAHCAFRARRFMNKSWFVDAYEYD